MNLDLLHNHMVECPQHVSLLHDSSFAMSRGLLSTMLSWFLLIRWFEVTVHIVSQQYSVLFVLIVSYFQWCWLRTLYSITFCFTIFWRSKNCKHVRVDLILCGQWIIPKIRRSEVRPSTSFVLPRAHELIWMCNGKETACKSWNDVGGGVRSVVSFLNICLLLRFTRLTYHQ